MGQIMNERAIRTGLQRLVALVGLLVALHVVLLYPSCRKEQGVVPSTKDSVQGGGSGGAQDTARDIIGLYVLNEGNMGSNKASLDYMDFASGQYERNIYAARNPGVVKELGDVGNDVKIYGSRLYIVVNASHKVEVLDARTAQRIGQVDVPNCRYLAFKGNMMYVSSYVGPIEITPDAPRGAVYEIDTASLVITRKCTVGYQPDELVMVGDYIYVANSGGYRAPEYDRTISVVDTRSMEVVRSIDVAINLHRVRIDPLGQMWVTQRGDYNHVSPSIHMLTTTGGAEGYTLTKSFDIPVTGFDFMGDSLIFYSWTWSNITAGAKVGYGVISISQQKLISSKLIVDGSDAKIQVPYGITVNAERREFYIADAKDYTSSGELLCFGLDGRHKWQVRTGDIPGHFAFLHNWR